MDIAWILEVKSPCGTRAGCLGQTRVGGWTPVVVSDALVAVGGEVGLVAIAAVGHALRVVSLSGNLDETSHHGACRHAGRKVLEVGFDGEGVVHK